MRPLLPFWRDFVFFRIQVLCNAIGVGGRKTSKTGPKRDSFVGFHDPPSPQEGFSNNALQCTPATNRLRSPPPGPLVQET
jgi:hypothetical protein